MIFPRESRQTIFDDNPFIAPPVNVEMKITPAEQIKAEKKTVIEDDFRPVQIESREERRFVQEKATSGVTSPQESSSSVVFELEAGSDSKSVFPLREGENTIGREAPCNVIIKDDSISRTHAMISIRSGKVTVKDLQSKNHTFVANMMITKETEIFPGAELQFGLVQARLLRKSKS